MTTTVPGEPREDPGRPPGLNQALRRAVERTTGYSPLCRHGEVMQALGRSLAEAVATLEAAAEAFRAAGDARHEGELQAYLLITLQRAGRSAGPQVQAEVAITGPLRLAAIRAS